MQFGSVDYAVLFTYLILTTILGIRLGRGSSSSTQDYFFASHTLPWWALSLSIVATETSTLTFIGIPAFSYSGNLSFFQIALGYVLGKIAVSFILIPAYFRNDIKSAYEILKSRFGTKIRNFTAGLFQLNRILADGVRLFATALVLSVVTQISDFWTVVIIGSITIIYTFYGGIKAVVWNDVLQLIVYLIGATIAFYFLLIRVPGGWQNISYLAEHTNKLRITEFSFSIENPYSFVAAIVGGAFLTFATHGTDQMMVQRYLSCSSQSKAQKGLLLSGLIVTLQFSLFLIIGTLLYSFYQHYPNHNLPSDSQRIFPFFIVEEMPQGISGLMIASVFAAAMSTLSSSLNSLASSTLNDFYLPYRSSRTSGKNNVLLSKVFTVIWGIFLIGVSLLARNWGSVLEVGLSITSVVMGAVLGAFLIGQWTRVKSELAVLTAMISGLVVVLLVICNRTYDWKLFPSIGWTWYILIGATTTIVVGITIDKIRDYSNAKALSL